MTRPVVGLLRVFFNRPDLDTAQDFADEVGEDETRNFLGGVWALQHAIDSIFELIEEGDVDEEGAEGMLAQLEADLDTCLEELGHQRGTPLC